MDIGEGEESNRHIPLPGVYGWRLGMCPCPSGHEQPIYRAEKLSQGSHLCLSSTRSPITPGPGPGLSAVLSREAVAHLRK